MKVRDRLQLLAGCMAIAMVNAGCVERLISITSEPSGALVHLNDEAVGRTPLTVPFTFYGVYDVRLEKDGFKPLWTEHKADAPWWELPGVDLLSQMVPGAKSHLKWHFELEALPTADGVSMIDREALVDRARQMRALAREGAGPSEQTPSTAENDSR